VRRLTGTLKRNETPERRWRVLAHLWAILIGAVTKQTDREETPARTEATPRRLDSWKEIASHLGRGVRTIQRWEREEGLPVHRLAHAKRGSVYADQGELNAWWESRQQAPKPGPAAASAETPREPRLERVTNTSGVTFFPSLSSDARLITFVSDSGQDGVAPQIWLQQIGGSAMRLTSNQRECIDPSFSADDTRVIYTARGDASLNVYEIPALGGQPRLLKRAAKGARMSPDGKWLAYIALDSPNGVRIARVDGPDEHAIAPSLIDVASVAWSPNSRHVVVHAHPDPGSEPDYWIASIDGRSLVNTGVIQNLRRQGFMAFLTLPPTWERNALVFSAVHRESANVWRQRLAPETFAPLGDTERLTRGTEMAWFPTVAANRLAFVSARQEMNLWSVAVDAATGMAYGPLRRMSRGPGVLGHLSVSADGRTLAYFSARLGKGSVFLRDLENGSETVVAAEPPNVDQGFPAISAGGGQLANATKGLGPRAMRPVFIVDLRDGTSRQLSDDAGGRPRQWLDERSLLIETFGSRLNTFLIIDTATGSQRELLASAHQSVTNPRVSPDGRWLAFDAARPGASPSVFVAPLDGPVPIPESAWIAVDDAASHPFWARDGRLLYYLSTTPSMEIRGVVRARRFDPASRRPDGESMVVIALSEMVVPTFLSGTAPIVAPDQILFVLGDFRGDIWMMDL
jgi:Tol biopolymer transport system component